MFNLFMLIGCWIVYGIMKAHEKPSLPESFRRNQLSLITLTGNLSCWIGVIIVTHSTMVAHFLTITNS